MENVQKLLSDFRHALPLHSKEELGDKYVKRAKDDLHDVILKLRKAISQEQKQENHCYLFSGLRGSGKTTELRRLVYKLREEHIHAYYCDASDYLNINNPEFGPTDIILTALIGFSAAIREKHGEEPIEEHGFFEENFRKVQAFWNAKSVESVSFSVAGIKLESVLKDNQNFCKALAEFAKSSNAFYDDAIDYANKLVEFVQKDNIDCNSKVVLVIDSMERFSATTGNEDRLRQSLLDTFFNNINKLRKLPFTVIYSVPPYIHAVAPNVLSGVSGYMTLSNFKVMEKDFSENGQGVDQMVKIIESHFPSWQKILNVSVLRYLAYQSGGNVRFLFQILHEIILLAAIRGTLPIETIKDDVVQYAAQNVSDGWQFLDKDDRNWLKRVKNAPQGFFETIEKDDFPIIIRLFSHALILNYQNGGAWYQLSPLLKDYLKL